MGVISNDTFDPLKRYISVRMQQGVPLVDADWNESSDVQKFELQAFIKWFIGDGVPVGCDEAFYIVGTGAINDFSIRAGVSGTVDGLYNIGRCLVNGLDVLISTDASGKDPSFMAQPLHKSQNPSQVLIDRSMGGGVILGLDDPSITPTGTVVAYLDVWERLITASEDANLVLPGLGTESCARLKREWVVRVRNGATAPAPGEAEYVNGHHYYALATIARHPGVSVVMAGDVQDLRQTSLTLTSIVHRLSILEHFLLEPAFDPSPGQFSPKVGSTGQTITLHGKNFNIGTPHVLFGTVEASLVGTPTASQIVARVPTGVTGNVKITVTTDGGTVVSDDSFTVA